MLENFHISLFVNQKLMKILKGSNETLLKNLSLLIFPSFSSTILSCLSFTKEQENQKVIQQRTQYNNASSGLELILRIFLTVVIYSVRFKIAICNLILRSVSYFSMNKIKNCFYKPSCCRLFQIFQMTFDIHRRPSWCISHKNK